MGSKQLHDVELLRKLLRYEPETGKLFWLPRPLEMFPDTRSGKIWNTRYAHKETFDRVDSRGYKCATLFGRAAAGHRIAWSIYHGQIPSLTIDHIDGNRANNRIDNLRCVSHQDNMRNAKRRSDNSSGFTGVYRHTTTAKWCAYIMVSGKNINLGCFHTIEEAVHCRAAAERDCGFHPNHGRDAV